LNSINIDVNGKFNLFSYLEKEKNTTNSNKKKIKNNKNNKNNKIKNSIRI
jgi:hypothetical protein